MTSDISPLRNINDKLGNLGQNKYLKMAVQLGVSRKNLDIIYQIINCVQYLLNYHLPTNYLYLHRVIRGNEDMILNMYEPSMQQLINN